MKKSVQAEIVDMVCGMVNYYSTTKPDREGIWDALTPFLKNINRDDPGYLALKETNQKERESQKTEDEK
jgi:hypothetical protein